MSDEALKRVLDAVQTCLNLYPDDAGLKAAVRWTATVEDYRDSNPTSSTGVNICEVVVRLRDEAISGLGSRNDRESQKVEAILRGCVQQALAAEQSGQ